MNTKRVLLVLGGLVVLATLVAGGFLFIRNNEQLWNPYYRAALEIEAAYGDYMDVTYIGPVESKPKLLAYVTILLRPFPGSDSPEWTGYEAMVGHVLGSLIVDEDLVLYILLRPSPNGPQPLMIIEFDAQALRAGSTMTDAIGDGYPFPGKLRADPYLKWINK